MIGFHLQRPVDDWPEAAAKLPAGAVFLAVDDLHVCKTAKEHNPGLITVFRHKADTQHPSGDYESNKQLARDYFETFIDGTFWQQELWRYIDYFKEWNEYPMDTLHFSWLMAVCDVWETEYRQVYPAELGNKPLVCISRPIGNDIPIEFARVVADYGNVLSYHNYTPVRDKLIWPNEWLHFSGRWTVNDLNFTQAGILVKWMFTEGGPILHPGDGHPDPNGGWLRARCLNGDVHAYNDVLSYQIDNIAAWNETHGNRAIGGVLFTSGHTGAWDSFELDQPEMNMIADHIREYTPDPVPPPAPPPTPYDVLGVDVSHHQLTMDWQTTAEAGAAFAFIRATNGTATDTQFWANWPEAKEAGILRGAYHYYRARVEPELQVNNFVNVVGSDLGELPPVLDCEDQAEPFTIAHLRETLDLIETAFGRKPIVYTNFNWWNQHVGVVDWASDYDLWVANWGVDEPLIPPGWDMWHFWQWTSDGDGPTWGAGSPRIDLDYWHGTLAELQAYAEWPPQPLWNKTVVLLPNNTNLVTWAKFAYEVHPHDMTLSADSAFAPQDLVGVHRVIVYDAEAWGGSTALEEWAMGRFGVLPVVEYR